MRKIQLAVGRDFKNRTILWPYKSKTGRVQPRAKYWVFSPATWLRLNIRPEPGQAFAYVDWSSAEFMIAASLSGDPTMLAFYDLGDPYLSFARRVGAVPQTATKQSHGAVRERYKTALLAAQYGVGPATLASRLGVSTFEAGEILAQHRQLFGVYWAWASDWLAHSLDTGLMWTPFDWQCRTGITEFNERSLSNFPSQASCADMLRIAAVWATRHGLQLVAPVHDAFGLVAPLERIDADVALLRELMRRASRLVLNPTAAGTLELRTDAVIVRHPNRFEDKRGVEMWDRVLALLAKYAARQSKQSIDATQPTITP